MKANVFSPRGMLVRAAWILVAYAVFHLLGFRDYTCVFCGTSPSGDPGDQTAILLGIVYVFLYFSAVVVVPVLVLGAVILLLLLLACGGADAADPAPKTGTEISPPEKPSGAGLT